MSHFFLNLKINWQVFLRIIILTPRRYLFIALFIVILFTLQWLFNIDQLIEIVLGDSGLSFMDRIDFLIQGFFNIFRYADDFVPLAILSIAALQATTLTLVLSFRTAKKIRSTQPVSLGVGLIGVGCVACGGSILTPILGLVASSVSVSFAERISELLLFIALVLSYISVTKISFQVAKKV